MTQLWIAWGIGAVWGAMALTLAILLGFVEFRKRGGKQ